ncbi:MAG: DUF2024 family protein [Chitinophagaceae bacterium]|nr:DUF2024 family protein [Chitinophagaceae bacterium]
MKVAVWDTYVTKKDGTIMHFDIIVPETMKAESTILSYGKAYLASINQEDLPLTSKECKFCHIETVQPHWENMIIKQGYYIFEMENCR